VRVTALLIFAALATATCGRAAEPAPATPPTTAPSAPAVAAPSAPAVATPPVPSATAAGADGIHAAVEQIVRTRVSALHTEAEVDAYLAELIARARRKGAVTALELEPGLLAIEQLRIDPHRIVEKQIAFSQSIQHKGPTP